MVHGEYHPCPQGAHSPVGETDEKTVLRLSGVRGYHTEVGKWYQREGGGPPGVQGGFGEASEDRYDLPVEENRMAGNGD